MQNETAAYSLFTEPDIRDKKMFWMYQKKVESQSLNASDNSRSMSQSTSRTSLSYLRSKLTLRMDFSDVNILFVKMNSELPKSEIHPYHSFVDSEMNSDLLLRERKDRQKDNLIKTVNLLLRKRESPYKTFILEGDLNKSEELTCELIKSFPKIKIFSLLLYQLSYRDCTFIL